MTRSNIVAIEPATSKTGKTYWRIKEEQGGEYACWSEAVAKLLHPGEAELEFEVKGKFINIISGHMLAPAPVGITPAQAATSQAIAKPADRVPGPDTRDIMIARQVALKAAVDWLDPEKNTPLAVCQMAQLFLNFLMGKQPVAPEAISHQEGQQGASDEAPPIPGRLESVPTPPSAGSKGEKTAPAGAPAGYTQATLGTVNDLYKAAHQRWMMQPSEVLKALNLKTQLDIVDPWACYQDLERQKEGGHDAPG